MPFLVVDIMIDASRSKEDDTMSHLKSLSFTAVPKQGANPTATRRAKLVALLGEHQVLAQDRGHADTRRRTVNEEGRVSMAEGVSNLISAHARVDASQRPPMLSSLQLVSSQRPRRQKIAS